MRKRMFRSVVSALGLIMAPAVSTANSTKRPTATLLAMRKGSPA